MKLCDLLQELKDYHIRGNERVTITKVCHDSAKAEPGSVFVCLRGSDFDGHDFLRTVIEAGAVAVVIQEGYIIEPALEDMIINRGGAMIQVPSTRYALAYLSAAFYGHPANRITTIGITGTKGKTTTAYLMREALQQAGLKVGLIGTIETIVGEEHIPAKNTTPEAGLLQEYLFRMVEAGMDAVVMEVSSQGLKMHRTEGFVFDYGIFTNLGEDHIGPNEHQDMDEYMECKSRLFKQCRVGIVNCDDTCWKRIVEGNTCQLETYGFSEEADYRVTETKLLQDAGNLAVAFAVKMPYEEETYFFRTATPGTFSVYNSLAAIALCRHFGIEPQKIAGVLKTARIKGRMEVVEVPDDYTLLIDYAHNAMSLESLLQTLREYEPNRLICLFGCGGNRSRTRRVEMGQVSGRLADLTIITSDNPRFEEPQAIIEDIKTGIVPTGGEYVEICDRREAIEYGMQIAGKGDVLVLAGKGHEDYQEIRGVKYPMDERIIIREILGKEGT